MSLDKGIDNATANLPALREALHGCRNILIMSHDNPDPDGVVSAILLQRVVRRLSRAKVTLAYSGVIGRAENRQLIEYAHVKLLSRRKIRLRDFDGYILVDTQPGTGNQSFSKADKVRAVFDHHRLIKETRKVPFYDVQTHIGAATTLIYTYCLALDIAITRRYATMMLYALRTETDDMGREASAMDVSAFKELYASADLRALARIIHARVGADYFSAVHRSIENTRVYGSVVVTPMRELPYPDAAAQLAEYFLKYRGIKHSFAIGPYGGTLLFSLRSHEPGAHLGRVARRIVRGYGTAGGHDAAAGGQVDIRDMSKRHVAQIRKVIIERLLKIAHEEGQRGRKLLSQE